MDKTTLKQYVDACELLSELAADIRRIQKQGMGVHDVVRGSEADFPYTERSFHIEGVSDASGALLERKTAQLEEQQRQVDELRLQVEAWMGQAPMRIRRIIRYRFFEGRSWESVARKMGRRATRESVRKEFERFLKNF